VLPLTAFNGNKKTISAFAALDKLVAAGRSVAPVYQAGEESPGNTEHRTAETAGAQGKTLCYGKCHRNQTVPVFSE